MSRAFGDFVLKIDEHGKYLGVKANIIPIPNIYTKKLKSSDKYHLVMASDGLWNGCTIDDVKYSLNTPRQFRESNIQKLIIKSLKKSRDNLTMIYIPINNK